MSKSHTVLHPIRHDGKPYNRGEQIPAGVLSEKEAIRLLAAGVISEGGGVVVLEIPSFGPEQLAVFTVIQLTEYAAAKYPSLVLKGMKKDEILVELGNAVAAATLRAQAEIKSEVSQAVQAGTAMAEAEAVAAAQGR